MGTIEVNDLDILHLEEILDDLKEHECNGMIMHAYPFISADIELLEHTLAKFKKTVCKDCGEDFSKK
jgi:hypothetical protein